VRAQEEVQFTIYNVQFGYADKS